MPIRWDALLVRHVAAEFDRKLSGARLRAIRLDGERREAVLYFRDTTLAWHLHPTRGDFRFHAASEPPEDALRLAGKVRAVSAPPDERLVVFRVLPVRGRAGFRDLVVELLGNQWNLLVAEGPDRIVRHLLHTRSKGREIRVGRAYAPPPPSERAGRDGRLDAATWNAIWATTDESARRKEFVRTIAWTSPLNRNALLGAGRDAGLRLWEELADPDALGRPVVLATDRGPHPYPFPLADVPSTEVATLTEAFAASVESDGPEEGAALVDPALVRRLERAVDGAARRRTSLEAQKEKLEDPEALRALGDLVLARYQEVDRAVGPVVLVGFDGEEVRVEVEAGEAPHATAERYYDGAAKAERAAERLPGLIEAAAEEHDRLAALLERAHSGDVTPEDIASAVPENRPQRGRDADEPTLPYRSYTSSGGLEIRVGRGARKNDDLTFHHSNPDDVWLHARHAAGAHVILRWSGDGNPPARDLYEAGVLAALHSKARTSGSVPVDWTRRKYVRKPRKSPPGSVLPERVQTVFVEPDSDLMERLSE